MVSTTTTRYTHLTPGKNIVFGIAGYYTPQQETRLPYNGREVMYVIGQVIMEAACCNIADDWVYCLVPGYIVDWQKDVNEEGEKITTVEPVCTDREKADIRKAIQEREGYMPVDFW
ncbi:MAG: hypothetical protein JW762_14060 [Dehalococcoidales bacterium]|nr:hypothetical protein [Dehalococcoidales bacterium]